MSMINRHTIILVMLQLQTYKYRIRLAFTQSRHVPIIYFIDIQFVYGYFSISILKLQISNYKIFNSFSL